MGGSNLQPLNPIMKPSNALSSAMDAALKDLLENQKFDSIYGVQEGSAVIASWPSIPCKIIFLDFDGVLNSDESIQNLGTKYQFSKSSIVALNELLKENSTHIVVTSTWREGWTLKENAEFLERDGLVPGRVIGKTPSLAQERGFEIDAWLRSVPFAVVSFVILDDRDDMAMHRNRLVQTNAKIGLTMNEVERARNVLQKLLPNQIGANLRG